MVGFVEVSLFLSLVTLVDTILQAIISMFAIPTPGAIGSIETPENEIRDLAERSHSFVCRKCKATEKILPPRPCLVCSNNSEASTCGFF